MEWQYTGSEVNGGILALRFNGGILVLRWNIQYTGTKLEW